MKKLIRVTSVPLSMEKLLGKQLTFMSDHYEVTAVSSDRANLKKVAENLGVKYHAVEMTREITPFKDLRSIYDMYRFFKKEKPDIVHSHTPKAGLVAMTAAALAGVPFRLHTVAGLPLLESSGLKRKILNAVESAIYACCTKVYPNSEELKKIILAEKFCPPEKLKVIAQGSSNGIDLDHFNPASVSPEKKAALREELGLAPKDFVFIYLGRIVKDKGINELVSGFKSLLTEQVRVQGKVRRNTLRAAGCVSEADVAGNLDELSGGRETFSEDSLTGLGIRKRLRKVIYRRTAANIMYPRSKVRAEEYRYPQYYSVPQIPYRNTAEDVLPHVKLLLVGPLEQKLNPILGITLAEIKSNPQIIAVDYVQDVRPYLAISDCLMLPSYREGFPNVVLQAGAMGLPSIVTDINGCNEIIEHQHNGLIVPVKDDKALTEAMKTILRENENHQNLPPQVLQEHIEKYSHELVWRALLEEYRAVSGEG